MSLRKLFGLKEKTESKKYRQSRAEALHGLVIRYVTERHGDNDDVIGRGGNISVRNGELIVLSSGETVFRAKTEELDASTLMSGDGVILTAPDREHGGVVRSITAHYVYHRK